MDLTGNYNDISFAGSRIFINNREYTYFMDDANPVQAQDTEISGVGMNFKGKLMRWSRGNPFMVSITVISGSPDDIELRKFLLQGHVTAEERASEGAKIDSMRIQVGGKSGQSYSFKNGCMVSGPAAPTATGEGKMQGNTYTMAFREIE